MHYIGRFAPSPTGLLHFGSLLAALASYLDARAKRGTWLLRIEDLDPPREQVGASDSFPETLEAFGLYWDGEITRQSQRLDLYQEVLEQLIQEQAVYRCNCSRKQLQQRSGGLLYDGYCQQHPPGSDSAAAYRVKTSDQCSDFLDRIQGRQHYNLATDCGDYVIRRKDNLFAYQLAVVVDDQLQQISHVVRGCDLLTETPKQRYLQQILGYSTPTYAHIPVAANAAGQKLSKQTYATALDLSRPVPQLLTALEFLDQSPAPALCDASVDEILQWAIEHWNIDAIPGLPAKEIAPASTCDN